MGCRDVHAATVLSFLCGIASVAGLFAGTLLPNWRKLRLITFNRNEKNLTVYTGLWVKCARYDGSSDCLMYDTTWYSSVDQLDLRVLQFALPLSILIAMGALLLCLIGMCNTAFRPSVPNIKLAKCLVNSAGCHLVARAAAICGFFCGSFQVAPGRTRAAAELNLQLIPSKVVQGLRSELEHDAPKSDTPNGWIGQAPESC